MVRWGALAIWLVLTTFQTHAYAQVWTSNLTLWGHASHIAPLKPRPAMNYGVSLLAAGQLEQGIGSIARASQLAEGAHVPWYDRQMTQQAVRRNLALLGVTE